MVKYYWDHRVQCWGVQGSGVVVHYLPVYSVSTSVLLLIWANQVKRHNRFVYIPIQCCGAECLIITGWERMQVSELAEQVFCNE